MEVPNYDGSYKEHFFRKRHGSAAGFAVGLLLFLLPFAQLKCGSMTMAENTGIGMAIGSKWKVVAGEDLLKESEGGGRNFAKATASEPNIFLLVCAGAGLAGLMVSLIGKDWRAMAGMGAGILACLMLLGVLIQFKIALRSTITDKMKSNEISQQVNNMIRFSFTFWYYASMASFAAAAFINYKFSRLLLQDRLDRLIEFEFQEKV